MKINYNDASYILDYKQEHNFRKFCCRYYVEPTEHNGYRLRCKIKLPFYILMFIPVHLLQLICLLWDGGIKQMSILPIEIENYPIFRYDYAADRIREKLKGL